MTVIDQDPWLRATEQRERLNEAIRSRAVTRSPRLGRRGTPRKLGVPGEDLPKVMCQVRDAAQYRRRRILCVGG